MTSAVDHAIVFVLSVAACAAPLAVGCTGEWARITLELAVGAAVMAWGLSRPHRKSATLWPLAVAALPLLQVLPLPDRLLTALAPVSAGAWKVAHQGDPRAFGCISVDPGGTMAAARSILLALATTAVVADLSRTRTLRRWLTAALAVTGVTLLILGVAFPVTKDNRALLGIVSLDGPLEFWRTPVEPPIRTSGWGFLEWLTVGDLRYQNDLGVTGDGFATFINSNHFAGAVGLTLPFALGWLCMLPSGRLPFRAGGVLAAAVWAAGVYIVGFMAHSRAGCAALVLAGMVFFTLQAKRPVVRKLLAGFTIAYAMFLLACVVVLVGRFVGMTDFIPDPWRQRFVAALSDDRAIAASVGARMFFASPLLGTGLGSYDDLYHKLIPGERTLYFAHNDYAQLLAETGLVGISAAIILGVCLCRRFLSFLKIAREADTPLLAAPWAAVAAIAAHSAFDFNLQVPANAYLAAVSAGLAWATAAAAPAQKRPPATSKTLASAFPAALLATSCAIALGFMVRDTFSDATLRQMRWALVGEKVGAVPPKDAPAARAMETALAAGERAYRYDPANARLALLVGRLHLHLATTSEVSEADRAMHRTAAKEWSTKAQRSCAVCRGIPEAMVLQPPRPQ